MLKKALKSEEHMKLLGYLSSVQRALAAQNSLIFHAPHETKISRSAKDCAKRLTYTSSVDLSTFALMKGKISICPVRSHYQFYQEELLVLFPYILFRILKISL
jgi:hypothetical protein